jgi:hypothetical protein
MTLLEKLALIRSQEEAKQEAKKPVITPINTKVKEILDNKLCISYKEAGVLGLMIGSKKNWHEGIKFLEQQGLGKDAQLIIMKDGAQPNTKNKQRMEANGFAIDGYKEVTAEELIMLLGDNEVVTPEEAAGKEARDKAAIRKEIAELEAQLAC